jgi:hypothetical protein
MQGSPTTGHDEVHTLQFYIRYESAAGRVRPRWSLRNDHISLAMGMASKGQSNMNALTGPMFNELYGKFAIRVTPYTRCFNYA